MDAVSFDSAVLFTVVSLDAHCSSSADKSAL